MSKLRCCFFSLMLLFIVGCREDQDEVVPEVSFTSPVENTVFKVGEAITVEANISDNELIRSITINLISIETGLRVLPTKSYFPNSSTYRLGYSYPISDTLIPTGSYYLRIEATDQEENTGFAFRTIRIKGLERKLISTVLSCESTNTTLLYGDNNDFNFSPIFQWSEPLFQSHLASRYQHYWFLSDSKEIAVRQLKEQIVPFSKIFPTGFNRAFSDAQLFNNELYLALIDGEIRKISPLFSESTVYLSSNDRKIEKLRVDDRYMAVEETNLDGSDRRLLILFRSSGALFTSVNLSQPLLDLFFSDEGNVILFANTPSGSKIEEFTINQNGMSGLRPLKTMNDSIYKVAPTKNNEFLMASLLKVKRFDLNRNSILDAYPIGASIIYYDDWLNRVYLATDKTLYLYENRPNLVLLSTATLPYKIKSINLRYNY